MRPQLIIHYGRVLSALLVTADGQLVPCSQEIRQVATRHVSADLLFDPHVSEDADFGWEEALEMVEKSTPRNLFQRAKKIGLRRTWDPQATADALQLASPISVLSSAIALADRNALAALPAVAFGLLDALLDPTFRFIADRRIAPTDVDPIIVLPANASRPARVVFEKLFRRRGFLNVTVVRREIAAAMTLMEEAPVECVVIDASDDHVHLHRVAIDSVDARVRRFRTVASATIPGLGWSHWTAQLAAALQTVSSSAFERGLLALLTGSPDSLPSSVTHGALQSVLDESWVAARAAEVTVQLHPQLEAIGGAAGPVILAGEIFALDVIRKAFGATAAVCGPVIETTVRGVASAMRWRQGGDSRRLAITRGGTLRLDTGRGEAIVLLTAEQLPQPGESCHLATEFRFAGDGSVTAFLLNVVWGADRVVKGNATLCALPLELRRDVGDTLRLTVRLRRSASGRRLSGMVEARMAEDVVAGRAQFSEELEVMR